jgi:hypothetical protein
VTKIKAFSSEVDTGSREENASKNLEPRSDSIGTETALASISCRRERRSSTISRACLCIAVIISGLALRGYGLGLGLPTAIVKYGGSVLWGTMVFFAVAIVASRLPRPGIAAIAALIAIGVELFRLVQAPGLDAFRLTTLGALLLGRVFSPWNMVAYGFGIAAGALLDLCATTVFAGAGSARDASSAS